ncbi:MAG: hypothetical protein ACLFS5_07710 [Spirochaetaceae bacterium]
MHTTKLTLAAVAALALFGACETVPERTEIPEDITVQEYFQEAQEAADRRHFQTALVYYETFIERHPDDLENRVAAEYEIAYLHYKMEEYDTAEEEFEDILARYESDEADQLPAWPQILAEKLLERVREERPPKDTAIPETESEPAMPAPGGEGQSPEGEGQPPGGEDSGLDEGM